MTSRGAHNKKTTEQKRALIGKNMFLLTAVPSRGQMISFSLEQSHKVMLNLWNICFLFGSFLYSIFPRAEAAVRGNSAVANMVFEAELPRGKTKLN